MISLESFSNSGDSVSVAVCVTPPSARVSVELARAVLEMRPALAAHTCKQGGFGCFGDKLAGATLPHLIEHLAIDFLVEEALTAPRVISGTTKWLNREEGKMLVRISCSTYTIKETCAAITRAAVLVNSLLQS